MPNASTCSPRASSARTCCSTAPDPTEVFALSHDDANPTAAALGHQAAPPHTAGVVERRRDLFWQNIVRESLLALATAAQSGGRTSPTPSGAAHSAAPIGEMFDGRISVITHLGQRIPIADIFPMFACSIDGTSADRIRSADVQCTVFRITTPAGETFTLPIGQIAMIHSLSDTLIRQMEAQAEAQAGAQQDANGDDDIPFGFAAWTSLSEAENESEGLGPAI